MAAETNNAAVQKTGLPTPKRRPSLASMANESLALASEAKSMIKAAEGGVIRAESIMARAVKERADQKAEQERAEKRRVQDEEKSRQEAEHKAQVEQELAIAETLRADTHQLSIKNRFAEALAAVNAKAGECRTPEGKAAMQALADRYTRLKDLRKFLIEHLNAAPLRWGWVQNRSPEDVLGAEDAGVRIRGRTVPWEEITARQMILFINKCLDNEQLKPRALSDQNLAAAIYCVENGGLEAARKYAAKAADYRPGAVDDVKRLIPEADPSATPP